MVESGDSSPGQVPMQRSAICWSPVCGREGLAAGWWLVLVLAARGFYFVLRLCFRQRRDNRSCDWRLAGQIH